MVVVAGGAHGTRGHGEVGDQSQTAIPDFHGEVNMQRFESVAKFKGSWLGGYLLYRPKNAHVAKRIALFMEMACNNPNIGYSTANRLMIYEYGVNASIPVGCDCTSLTGFCIQQATLNTSIGHNGYYMPANMIKSGLFYDPISVQSLNDTTNPPCSGDVICSPIPNKHIEVIVQGANAGFTVPLTETPLGETLEAIGDYIESFQEAATINLQNTHPYVIRIDEGVLGIDFDELREIGVVGALINAGQRYNKRHQEVPYRSETVYLQVLEALKAKMPFGFFYTTHARDILEVKEEAYWFYFVISKYPPKLGVWLRCDLDVDEETAEEIVNKWYEYFVKWGLKTKCGLYCTDEQAELIGWPNQAGYMPMWAEEVPIISAAPDDEILVPSFFAD